MRPEQLQSGRKAAGLTQVVAAQRLGLSQPYLSQLERGRRPVPAHVAERATRVYGLRATALPVREERLQATREHPARLARELAALGYPGFTHLRGGRKVNPAELLLDALSHDDLEVRVTEALPWVLLSYPDLHWDWLVREVKLRNLQNRLGFLVATARALAAEDPDSEAVLIEAQMELERARLAAEDTLCRVSMPDAERRWLASARTETARHWHLLTGLAPEQLVYGPA